MRKKVGGVLTAVIVSTMILTTQVFADSALTDDTDPVQLTETSQDEAVTDENKAIQDTDVEKNVSDPSEPSDNEEKKEETNDLTPESETDNGDEQNSSEKISKNTDTAEPSKTEGINAKTENGTPSDPESVDSAELNALSDNNADIASVQNKSTKDKNDNTESTGENKAASGDNKTLKNASVSDNDLPEEELLVSDPKGDSYVYNNLRYEIAGSGNVKIIGYTGDGTGALNIPAAINGKAVTEIGDRAFWNSGFSGALVIPNSVVTIGESAFAGCTGFTSLTLGNKVEQIKYEALAGGAFQGCTGFRGALVIPDSVRIIEQNSFYGCNGFSSLTLGKNIREIHESAFLGCTGFRGNLTIPDSVTYIPKYCFKECDGFDGNLVIGNGVTRICTEAFQGCSGFKSLKLGNKVTSIEGDAFNGCSGFKGSLVIPNTVTEIGASAFDGCSGFNGTLTIGDHTTSIGQYAFRNCSGFTGTLTIPDSVYSIGDGGQPHGHSFQGCSGFTVLKIGKYADYQPYKGDAYDGCSKVKTVINNASSTIRANQFLSNNQECFVSSTGEFVGFNDWIGKGTFTRQRVVAVTGVALNTTSLYMYKGQSGVTLSATVSPSNASDKSVVWSSSNTSVAVVDENGNVRAVSSGTAVITARANNGGNPGKSAKCTVTVEDKVEAFVTRLYRVVLERDPDASGKAYWVTSLKNGSRTGADVVAEFYISDEMKGRGLSNSRFVDLAYNGIMGRTPDANGKAYWIDGLDSGASYEYVACGFIESQEFTNLCSDYGINKGNRTPSEARDRNIGVTKYASRLYTQCLGRGYDTNGLNYWCQRILDNPSRENVISVAADGFFHSDEFLGKNLNNDEYIRVCYRTFLGREAEGDGFNYWKQLLDSGAKSRDDLIRDFAYSQEFSGIMASYGL